MINTDFDPNTGVVILHIAIRIPQVHTNWRVYLNGEPGPARWWAVPVDLLETDRTAEDVPNRKRKVWHIKIVGRHNSVPDM